MTGSLAAGGRVAESGRLAAVSARVAALEAVSAPAGPLAPARVSPGVGAWPGGTLPAPHLYLAVFGVWLAAILWFQERLWGLLAIADGPLSFGALLFFVVFTQLAWLYGLYNVGVIVFAVVYRATRSPADGQASGPGAVDRAGLVAADAAVPVPVALLYTTYNDFVESSARSCLAQDYPAFTLYILDDSTDAGYRERVDAFAAAHPARVRVVRRPDRAGFKAGNINHALARAATTEPLFALVDADEILPPDFLRRLVPRLTGDPGCGFVQANHRCNPASQNTLQQAMGVGIDIHWRWYQPLRNRFGFVMLLGHGALIRRRCWEEVGGFPELVSEDLAFAIRLRERGWRGWFAEDVVCYEDFPETIRAFRIRHMKWTRGTCELLGRELGRLLRARRISLVEKLDILFPTLSLPLALFYFLFIVNANLVLMALFGQPRPVTFVVAGVELTAPLRALHPHFASIMTPDFFAITSLTLVAPILCFIIDLAHQPRRLFRFLARSTAVYASLAPLSCFGVVSYLVTRRATFFVTGDRSAPGAPASGRSLARRVTAGWKRLVRESHPDHLVLRGFELACGITFAALCLRTFQVAFLGVAIGFALLPVLHQAGWDHPVLRRAVYLPFLLIVAGLTLGGMSVFGLQPVFFGYGFHF
jgi:cellulose synthase/poly-beta-1,6-N-acetylglucosamine synthase-like glycosyltransferase